MNILIIILPIVFSQSTIVTEEYRILGKSYLQLGQIIVDVQKQNFKVSEMQIDYLIQSKSVQSTPQFSVLLFQYDDVRYPCVAQLYQFPNASINIADCDLDVSNGDCPSQIQFNNSTQYFTNCNAINITWFSQEIKNSQTVYGVMMILNENENIIEISTVYKIIIDNSFSFYQISLVLSVLLGIFIVGLVSYLCILYQKYQMKKKDNMKMKFKNPIDADEIRKLKNF